MLTSLKGGFAHREVDVELQRLLRDVADHVIRIAERADGFRALLQNALTVHSHAGRPAAERGDAGTSPRPSLDQNEEVKRISAWAAILFAPTLVGGIYGMNFDHMPELHWRYGYPLALLAMLAMGLTLYLVFKRKRWL